MIKSRTRWELAKADTITCNQLQTELEIDPLLARLLVIRGITEVQQAKRFLHVTQDDLHDPFLLPNMEESVNRIQRAIVKGERILIYGDYDCDGVTSTALLYDCIKDFTNTIDYYIPNRFTEGYGLNTTAVTKANEAGVTLLITVDTGISAVHEVAYANQLGLDVIITDHHEPPEILPNAYSIINPKLSTSTYPFPLLAGVGVSFKLALAISGKWKPYWMEWAAIGTIADLVPLIGENRILAKLGLGRLNESPTVGVDAIIRSAGINQKEITAGHIGFTVAPRINASGRLDTASAAVDLLLCQDEKQAVMFANQLSNLNEERQHLVQQTIEEAKLQVEADPEGNKYCIVVGHRSWNAGVIGIVASKLVDLYYRPTIVCSFDDEQGIAKGSARSISGFHLYESLRQCEDVLTKYGGHEMAAGMSLKIEHFQLFKKKMNEVAEKSLAEEDYIPRTVIDASLSIAEMDVEIIKQLQRLAPFGMGNRTPRLMIEDVTIQDKRYMGREQEHVKLLLKKGNYHLNAIAFKKREQMENLSLLASPKLCGELSINEWNGRTEPQFIIHDIDVDKIQIHDFRNKEANACLDWKEKTKPVLLFFTEEAKQGFIRLNGHINPAVSSYIVRWSEELDSVNWEEITHLFLMEVPNSDTLFKGMYFA